MKLPIFFSNNRPKGVHCVYDKDAHGIILQSMFVREGLKSVFPAFWRLGPDEVDKG